MRELLQALTADRYEDTQDSEVTIRGDGLSQADPAGGDETSLDTAASQESRPSIEVHPNARSNFDAKAEALFPQIVRSPVDANDTAPQRSRPNLEQIATVLPKHATRGNVEMFRDAEGNVVARCFTHNSEIVGLQGDGYRALRELAEALQKIRSLRELVGVGMVERLMFEWVRARVFNDTQLPMTAYVVEAIQRRIAEFEVFIPLFRIELPDKVQIGRVVLRPIMSADFARWEAVARGRRTKVAATTEHVFELARKKMQGFAAATLSLYGEQHHVIEIAREEADEAASILRLFSPAIISPVARSFCALWGRHNLESTDAIITEGAKRIIFETHADTSHDYIWRITPERLHLIRRDVLDVLVAELYSGKPGEFREEIRTALLLYSRSALRSVPAEKLLAILIPLETLLLRNQSEPITDTIAIRLAFAIGATFEDRKRIVETVKAAYALRSGYVHHGQQITSLGALDTLREFMRYAWLGVMEFATRAVVHYNDRLAYLSSLEDRKLA